MANTYHAMQAELTKALLEAEKKVQTLKKLLAHSASLLGDGIEAESMMGRIPVDASGKVDLFKYIELIEQEDDLSNFIGSDDVEGSRPRLGSDAPEFVRPKDTPLISPNLHGVIAEHATDNLSFDPTPAIEEPTNRKNKEPKNAQISSLSSAKKHPAPVEAPAERTEKKQIKVLEEVHNRIKYALQTIHPGIWDCDLTQSTLWVSFRWQELIPSSTQEETPLEGLCTKLTSLDTVPLRLHFEALLSHIKSRFSVPVRLQNAPENTPPLRLNALCLYDDANRPTRLVCTATEEWSLIPREKIHKLPQQTQRIVAEFLPDLMFRFNAKGQVQFVSPSIKQYIIDTPAEITDQPFSVLDGKSKTIIDYVLQVSRRKVPLRIALPLFSMKAGIIQVSCFFWPELDTENNVINVVLHLQDQTFANYTAQAYKTVFTGMSDGFAVFEYPVGKQTPKEYTGKDFFLLLANPAFSQLIHFADAEPVGLTLHELLPKEADLFVQQCIAPYLFNEQTNSFLFHKTQQGHSLEVSTYLLKPGSVACIIKNVVENKRFEQEMRLNEARFAALYRLSHMDLSPEEEVIQFSLDQAVQLTGSNIGFLYMAEDTTIDGAKIYCSQEILNTHDAKGLQKIQEMVLAYRKKTKNSLFHRARIVNQALETIPLLESSPITIHRYILTPVIEDGKIVCIAGVANKIYDYETTDLRQLELFINGMWFQLRKRRATEQLQGAKNEAETANRTKSEFLANVSHELRTPLNGILGMLQLLQYTTLSSQQQDYVATANYSGRSLLRIISDILDFSRIEAGRFILEPHPFNLTETIEMTLRMFVLQAEQKKIKFIMRMANNIPKWLMGDDARIRQIIFNLVGNAFKFTDTGEITLECSVLPRCQKDKCCIYIAVKDTGIGISDDNIANIFKAFTQLDGSKTRRYAGTGLGLGIVQRLIAIMGGNATIESELGVGTTIHCSIPFAITEHVEEPTPKGDILPPLTEQLELLVAEDDPINRLTIRRMLQKNGHHVVCVNDGRQAIEALLLKPFDCLLTDIQMVVMDGTEVISRIRENKTDDIEPTAFVAELLEIPLKENHRLPISVSLPVIALTAHAMTGDKEYYLNLGMDYYLPKPISAIDLEETIQKVGVMLQTREENKRQK